MPGRESPLQSETPQGTLDMLVLKVLVMGAAHGHTIAHAIERGSDDVLQIEHVAAEMGGHERSTQHQHLNDLLRLYDTIDNSLMTHGCSFSLALVFLSLVINPVFERSERSTPNFGGRSPPQALPA